MQSQVREELNLNINRSYTNIYFLKGMPLKEKKKICPPLFHITYFYGIFICRARVQHKRSEEIKDILESAEV